MVQSVGGVKIEIRGDDSHFERTMRGVRSEAGRTGQTMAREFRTADAAATKLNTSIKSTGASMLALTAAFGVGAGLAGGVRIIANFSQAMATLRAITGAATDEIAKLEATARALGSSTKYSASQAADAMTELARAGFDTNQVLAAIPSVLSLATAGGVELAAAAEITGVTLAQFGLQAAEAARVADVLAEAANRSNVGVTDLGEALKYAGPTGKALGLDLEQTVAVLAALGDGGLKGGQGGRSFGSVGVQLVNEREAITKLIGTYDIAAEGIQGVIKRLVQAGITTEQVISIFRGENIDTFNILAEASTSTTKSIDGFVKGLKEAEGSSARVAAVMADNLNGALLGAASAFEEVIIALGKAGAEKAILDLVQGLTELLRLAARNADALAVAVVALTARAIIPMVATAVPAAIGALRNLAGSLLFVQGTAARTALAINALGGPTTLVVLGLAAAYLAMARDAEKAEERLERANAAMAKAKDVLGETQSLLEGGNSPFEQIADQASGAVSEVASLTDAVTALQTGLANLRQEGQIATALRLGESLAEINASIAELERARDQFVAGRTFGAPVALKDAARVEALDKFGQTDQGSALLFATQQRAALESRLKLATQGLTPGDLINQFRNGSPAAPTAATPAAGGGPIELTKAELRDAQDELDALLDDAEDLFAKIQDERNAGTQQRYDEFNLNRAEAKTAADAATQQRYDEFNLNKAAEDKLRASISRSLAQGLEDGIRSGNWGEAFQSILAQSTSEALSKAINELASQLVNILGDAIGSSGFSGFNLGSLFGGGKAAGGPVKAGMRYMVGEKGPEMFVPTVPGVILPKSEFPSSSAMGGGGGSAINITAPFIVQGSITEDVLPRVQAMLAEQSRQLPRIIDSQVKDSTRRGRYS